MSVPTLVGGHELNRHRIGGGGGRGRSAVARGGRVSGWKDGSARQERDTHDEMGKPRASPAMVWILGKKSKGSEVRRYRCLESAPSTDMDKRARWWHASVVVVVVMAKCTFPPALPTLNRTPTHHPRYPSVTSSPNPKLELKLQKARLTWPLRPYRPFHFR